MGQGVAALGKLLRAFITFCPRCLQLRLVQHGADAGVQELPALALQQVSAELVLPWRSAVCRASGCSRPAGKRANDNWRPSRNH